MKYWFVNTTTPNDHYDIDLCMLDLYTWTSEFWATYFIDLEKLHLL